MEGNVKVKVIEEYECYARGDCLEDFIEKVKKEILYKHPIDRKLEIIFNNRNVMVNDNDE